MGLYDGLLNFVALFMEAQPGSTHTLTCRLFAAVTAVFGPLDFSTSHAHRAGSRRLRSQS